MSGVASRRSKLSAGRSSSTQITPPSTTGMACFSWEGADVWTMRLTICFWPSG